MSHYGNEEIDLELLPCLETGDKHKLHSNESKFVDEVDEKFPEALGNQTRGLLTGFEANHCVESSFKTRNQLMKEINLAPEDAIAALENYKLLASNLSEEMHKAKLFSDSVLKQKRLVKEWKENQWKKENDFLRSVCNEVYTSRNLPPNEYRRLTHEQKKQYSEETRRLVQSADKKARKTFVSNSNSDCPNDPLPISSYDSTKLKKCIFASAVVDFYHEIVKKLKEDGTFKLVYHKKKPKVAEMHKLMRSLGYRVEYEETVETKRETIAGIESHCPCCAREEETHEVTVETYVFKVML